MLNNFSSGNFAVYAITWKNMIHPDKPHIVI